MKTAERIKETLENGIEIECNLIGDGSIDNPFRPEIFETHKGYYHLESIDYKNKKCKLWVNKLRTAEEKITAIKSDSKFNKIKETTK